MRHELVGKIVRGQGLATGYSKEPVVAHAIGSALYPGTINVLVPDPKGQHRFIGASWLRSRGTRRNTRRFTVTRHPATSLERS